MNQRLNYIDRLKGFAIILVVMGHLYFFSYDKSVSPVASWISSFHMPLFMFLSGLVVSTPDLKKVKKQLYRLLIPMFVFGLIFTFSYQRIHTFGILLKVFFDFVMSESKNGYWYLMSLGVFYCSMLLFRLNKKSIFLIDLLIALVLYILYGLGWKYGGVVSNILCLLNCTCYFPFFICAYFIKKYDLMQWLIKPNWIWLASFVGYLVLMNIDIKIHVLDSLAERFIIPMSAIIVIVRIFVKREQRTSFCENALGYLGRNTLDIYVLHYFIVYNLNLVAFDRWTMSTNNVVLSMVVTLTISVPIAYLTVWVGKILRKNTIVSILFFGETTK